MVNVVGVGIGGSRQQQQHSLEQSHREVLSISNFLASIPIDTVTSGDAVPPLNLQLPKPANSYQMQQTDCNLPPATDKMTARATLQCRPNSHPFHERSLLLDSPVKIGRSVARSRPSNNNAIFDCKVLSRNHALLWYEDGKFYLQDTKSSNGTFVNNQRLSKGSEESAPREVCSGDLVQFGVDVMENSRKVTHGCIIATLRLFMPDGQEAKASPSLSVTGLPGEAGVEVQQLRTCLQEALFREAAIQAKLQALSAIIQATQDAANQSWSAMIGEDRLLQKLEMMEAQLATYAKNWPEDRLREEVCRLHQEKCQYESHVKESIARMLSQKNQALTRLGDAERSLASSEAELSQLRVVAESSQQQLTELLEQQTTHSEHATALQQQLQAAEALLKEQQRSGGSAGEALNSDEQQQELLHLRQQLAQKCAKEEQLLAQVESASADADFTKQQLAAMQARYSSSMKQTDEQKLSDAASVCTGGVVTAEQRLLAARLKQYQAELASEQTELHTAQKEITAAEQAEEHLLEEQRLLQEDLAKARSRALASSALLSHLKQSMAFLQSALSRCSHHSPSLNGSMEQQESLNMLNSAMPDLVAENGVWPSPVSQCDTILSPEQAVEKLDNILNNGINKKLPENDLVANNNDINAGNIKSHAEEPTFDIDHDRPAGNSVHIIDSCSEEPPPKIYDDVYDDEVRKKDPSEEDDITSHNKDAIPENSCKEKSDAPSIDHKACEVFSEDPDDKLESTISPADDDDDLDSVSTDTTLAAVETVILEADLEPVRSSDNGVASLVESLELHVLKLRELRTATHTKHLAATEQTEQMLRQLQHISTAAATASLKTRAQRAALLNAERGASSKAAVVCELQQSAARLGAAGTIIKQQLEQLNAQLVQQRQLVAEERAKSLQLTERLQEAEALAAEGVQQTESLNKQLHLLKQRVERQALAAESAAAELAVDTELKNGQSDVSVSTEQTTAPKPVNMEFVDVSELQQQIQALTAELAALKLLQQKSDECSKSFNGEYSDSPILSDPATPRVSSPRPDQRDTPSHVEENLVNIDVNPPQSSPISEDVGNDVADSCQKNVVLTKTLDVEEELKAVQREYEELKSRLLHRDEEFALLALQNKTHASSQYGTPPSVHAAAGSAQALTYTRQVPWWLSLLLAVIISWFYNKLP